MQQETLLFFDNLRGEDRSILDLLDSDYTFVNEELARHYGLAHVTGPQMRRVAIRPEDHRGGLLGMSSILTLTSHTDRTKPTARGKWVLQVLLGTPPAPPPADAGSFKETRNKQEPKNFRERLALHSSNATCAGCHKKIDPLGFAMENYDAIGTWREQIGGQPVDNKGRLPGTGDFQGIDGLKQVLHARQDQFVRNLAVQMMTYALGRQVEYEDELAIVQICERLQRDNYRFSSLIHGVVTSRPFQFRRNTASSATREMMVNGNIGLSRRAVLRGMGACVALPWLESLARALPGAEAVAAAKPPLRMGIFTVTGGTVSESWVPGQPGALEKMPSILRALEPHKSELLVLSNLSQSGRPDNVNSHEHCAYMHLTAADKVGRINGKPFASVGDAPAESVEQRAARLVGDQSLFASMEIGLAGGEQKYSYRRDGSVVPYENDPRLIFERMFKGRSMVAPNWRRRAGALPADPARAIAGSYDKQVVDLVLDDARSLNRKLGANDRQKLGEYLEAIDAIERRLEQDPGAAGDGSAGCP